MDDRRIGQKRAGGVLVAAATALVVLTGVLWAQTISTA